MLKFFSRHSDWSILFFRIGIAMVFIYHGYGKLFAPGGLDQFTGFLNQLGFPLPKIMAYLAGGAEFFGGIMIGVGLFARVASLFIIITMMVAVFVHRNDGYAGMEFAVHMLVLSIGTLFSGSGKYSLESLVKRHGD
jgi:putative oxidoreductase